MDGGIKQKPKFDVVDDLRQSVVVMRNEIKKFLRGKKLIAFAAILALILLGLSAAAAVGHANDPQEIGYGFTIFTYLIIILAATLFSSTSIAAEYDERTALILFTKPIRKWSIYFGKLLASLAVDIIAVSCYYAVIVLVSLALTGNICGNLSVSFGLALCYVVGATGFALMMSSLMSKGSTAAIMTFALLLIVFSVVSFSLQIAFRGMDLWFMIDQASASISGCFIPSATVHGIRDAAVMIVWGVVTAIVGYFAFHKREY